MARVPPLRADTAVVSLIKGFLTLWYSHRTAEKYAVALTAILREVCPAEKFKIKCKVSGRFVTFSIDTDSKHVLACWILIQEAMGVPRPVDEESDKVENDSTVKATGKSTIVL